MNTRSRNILLVNVDSVIDSTYSLMKDRFSSPFAGAELAAYSVSAKDTAVSTIGFFLTLLRNDEPAMSEYRKSCWVAETPGENLLTNLRDRGYTTVFASEWPYHPTVLSKLKSPFTDWLGKRFDYYLDSQGSSKIPYDSKRILAYVRPWLKEPWFLVVQLHDTHIPFWCAAVNNWMPWGQEINKVLRCYGHTVDEIVPLFYKKQFRWTDLPSAAEATVKSIMARARVYQLEALKYGLDNLSDFVTRHDDVIYHLIGDHHTFLGEIDYFGNAGSDITMQNHPEFLRTMWLTNQTVPRDKEYRIADFYSLIGGVYR